MSGDQELITALEEAVEAADREVADSSRRMRRARDPRRYRAGVEYWRGMRCAYQNALALARPARSTASRGIHSSIVQEVPKLRRGRVWCHACGAEREVDAAKCLASGWPKCCGSTMSIDSPEERAAQ